MNPNEWTVVLHDNYPGIKTLESISDAERWKRQMETMLTRKTTCAEILGGIHWALVHFVRPQHFFVPGPQDLVSWIRHASHAAAKHREERARGATEYRRLTEGESKAIAKALHNFNAVYFLPDFAKKALGDGYALLESGSKIMDGDEYWDGEDWAAYGNQRPRVFTKYKDAWARRKETA